MNLQHQNIVGHPGRTPIVPVVLNASGSIDLRIIAIFLRGAATVGAFQAPAHFSVSTEGLYINAAAIPADFPGRAHRDVEEEPGPPGRVSYYFRRRKGVCRRTNLGIQVIVRPAASGAYFIRRVPQIEPIRPRPDTGTGTGRG